MLTLGAVCAINPVPAVPGSYLHFFYQHPWRSATTDKMTKVEGKDTKPASTASMENFNSGTTHRGLKPRHSQMIALGGCVGTGLFVGTGATLATGGPAFILAGFIIMSMLVYCVVTTIVEISAYLPISGASMSYYASRYVSPSLGVAMGWLYVYSLGILVPYEITAGALVIDYWDR